MIRRFSLMGLLLLAACAAKEPAEKPYYWKLVAIDGVPFTASARLAFVGENTNRVIGDAPCNSFTGDVVKEPFPTVRIVNLVATERACDDLAAEQAFFAALSEMTGEGVGIGYLYFVNDAGRRLDFKPEADLNPGPTAG